jgi:hypothetical protein
VLDLDFNEKTSLTCGKPANQCLAPGVLLSNLVLGTSGLGTGITW